MTTTIDSSSPLAETASPTRAPRLHSLDVFRGLTIAMMVIVNNQGGKMYTPLDHVEWHGWTPTDLVFPFFLFIVGVAIPFSLAKRRAQTDLPRGRVLGHIWLRALSIFMLGQLTFGNPLFGDVVPDGFFFFKFARWTCVLFVYASMLALLIPWRSKRIAIWLPVVVTVLFYALALAMVFVNRSALKHGLPVEFKLGSGLFHPQIMRIPGVLQRIGIVYGIAASIALLGGWKWPLFITLGLFIVYSAIMLGVRLPNHVTGSLTQEDNVARRVDEFVLDKYTVDANGARQYVYKHSWRDYPDNEGLLSTLPAIGSALLGVMVGPSLRRERPMSERATALLGSGLLVTIAGVLLSWWLMPINKNIWTPSFTVFTAGLAMLTLGTTLWIVDINGWRRTTLPLAILGLNAIVVFMASAVIPRWVRLIHVQHGEKSLSEFTNNWLADHLHRANAALQHLSAHLPAIDSQQNISLAYSLVFLLVIFLISAVLYLCRIFVKV